ncbi:MAG: outer membrane beta-barrel protein, partial [Luteolibacter sp.]
TGEGGFIKVAYHPTAVIYAKNDSDNRVDQQALLTAGWRGKVTQLTYKGAIQKLGDATADTGRQTDRLEFENELRAAWQLREKVTLELAIGNQQSDYSDPTLFDSSKIYAEIASRYAYSPKTQLGLAYQVARFKVQGSPDQDTHQLTGGIDWQPREKIRIFLKAGGEYRKVANDSQVNPVLEGRTEWTPREGTGIYITAYQRQTTSAFYAGQIYTAKGVTAGVSQRLNTNWTARFEGGMEKATYSRVSGSGASGRSDRIWFVRPSLEYKISDEFNVAVFYRASEDSSNDPSFGYAQQMAGVEFVYKF